MFIHGSRKKAGMMARVMLFIVLVVSIVLRGEAVAQVRTPHVLVGSTRHTQISTRLPLGDASKLFFLISVIMTLRLGPPPLSVMANP